MAAQANEERKKIKKTAQGDLKFCIYFMAKECRVAKWVSEDSLEVRLVKEKGRLVILVEIERFSDTFQTMIRPAYDWAKKQLKKYGDKIGANIVTIEEEHFSADHREYTVSGVFYRLVE